MDGLRGERAVDIGGRRGVRGRVRGRQRPENGTPERGPLWTAITSEDAKLSTGLLQLPGSKRWKF